MVLKKSSATKKSVTTSPVKKTSGLRWIAVLSMPIIGLLRFLVSIVFFLIGLVAADPSSPMAGDSLLAAIQPFSNRGLGILGLLSIPLTIVGIIVLVKNGQGLIYESIATGRAGAKKYIGEWIGFFMGCIIITIIIFGILQGLIVLSVGGEAEDTIITIIAIILIAIILILSQIFSICAYTAAIHVIYNNTLMWKSYFDVSFMKIVKYIFAWIMYGASIMLGLILLVIPGIIVMVRCSFFNVAVLKDGLSPLAAIKRSRQITKGNFWNVLGLMIIQRLIQIPGRLALLVGLFWTLPTAWMSDVKAYQTLSEAKKQ